MKLKGNLRKRKKLPISECKYLYPASEQKVIRFISEFNTRYRFSWEDYKKQNSNYV